MRTLCCFFFVAVVIALGAVLEGGFALKIRTQPSKVFLEGPEGPMVARAIDDWCPRPPDLFVSCEGKLDRVRIRPATAAEAGLLSGFSGPASPWRLEGWATRAAAFGLNPADGDAPDADLSGKALVVAAEQLPPSSFLAAIPAGGEGGRWRATIDISRPDNGPRPWRLMLIEIRMHHNFVWTLQGEIWTDQAPNRTDLDRLRQASTRILEAIESPQNPDVMAQSWARIARPDGPDRGNGRVLTVPGGWRLEGLPVDEVDRSTLFAQEAATLIPALTEALDKGEIDQDLALAFARAAIRAADGPPGPAWGPASASCGRGLGLKEGRRICLLPDGRVAAAYDLPDGARLVFPLATRAIP